MHRAAALDDLHGELLREVRVDPLIHAWGRGTKVEPEAVSAGRGDVVSDGFRTPGGWSKEGFLVDTNGVFRCVQVLFLGNRSTGIVGSVATPLARYIKILCSEVESWALMDIVISFLSGGRRTAKKRHNSVGNL